MIFKGYTELCITTSNFRFSWTHGFWQLIKTEQNIFVTIITSYRWASILSPYLYFSKEVTFKGRYNLGHFSVSLTLKDSMAKAF